MEIKLDLNESSVIEIPEGTTKITLRIATTAPYSEELLKHFNDLFLQRLGGHENFLRTRFTLCLSVRFKAEHSACTIEFTAGNVRGRGTNWVLL